MARTTASWRRPAVLLLATVLAGCAHPPASEVRGRVDALLPADAILLGEQHDADAHQQLQRAVVLDLARRGQLAGLAIEMAEQGRSTRALAPMSWERKPAEVKMSLLCTASRPRPAPRSMDGRLVELVSS